MRLFAAIVPPSVPATDLEAAVQPVRARHPGLRWVPAADRHLTLAFYGELSESQVPVLSAALDEAAAAGSPFPVSLGAGGNFGARTLWLAVSGDGDVLAGLAAAAVAAGRSAGVPSEERAYHPHLTLARGRRGLDVRPAARELAGHAGPAWTVAEVVLMRSEPGRRPAYAALRACGLGAGGRGAAP